MSQHIVGDAKSKWERLYQSDMEDTVDLENDLQPPALKRVRTYWAHIFFVSFFKSHFYFIEGKKRKKGEFCSEIPFVAFILHRFLNNYRGSSGTVMNI